jgi:hypothetical protein
MEYVAIFFIFAVIVVLLTHIYLVHRIISKLQETNADLLNRLMARDYKEYAVFEHNKEVVKQFNVAGELNRPEVDGIVVD